MFLEEVLLVVVPSMTRACTLLLLDDIVRCDNDVRAGAVANLVANYAEPAFSRSNVHSVMALSSMLTPLFTCIRTATIMIWFLYLQPFLYLKHGRGCEQRWRLYFNFFGGRMSRP